MNPIQASLHETIIRHWRCVHDCALFFADFPSWLMGKPDYTDVQLHAEYDSLFKGVNADVYVPLWASACLGREDQLLDATTLGVVHTYHAWSYDPVPMDGNPPDFIGQQFRFVCSLCASALRELEHKGDCKKYTDAVVRFQEAYLKPTVDAVVAGIRENTRSPVFLAMADKLAAYTPCLPDGDCGLVQNEGDLPLAELYCYEIYVHGTPPPKDIPDERIVNTAGRNNCGGKCVIRARTQAGCILDLSTDCGSIGSPPLRACARGRAYRQTYITGQRLRYPMQRTGERGEGRFRRISWEEAVEIVAAEWIRIRDTYGVSSRYVNYATGVSALFRPDAMARRLLNLDGGHLGLYNSYSSACANFTTPFIYGDTLSGNSIADVLNTKLLILWGHNPVETIFGSERNYYLAAVKKKGIPIVVIDPRQSDTAVTYADQWIALKPSTDAALADAMAYVIWSEGLHNQQFMDRFCQGFDEAHLPPEIQKNQSYEAYLFGKKDGIPKTPAWAEPITGVSAAVITGLAREYAKAKPACLMPGLGLQRTGNGEQAVRTIAALTCLTGNVGIPGGGAAGTGWVPGPARPVYAVGTNPYPGAIPSFLWTRAVSHALDMTRTKDGLQGVEKLDTNIKMILNLAGNTLVNQHSDINRTIHLLKETTQCEFILGSDVFMTPSARFADVLLPASSFFEEDNIAPPWDFADYLLHNNRVIEPLFDCRFEYEFLAALARKLNLFEPWSEGYATYGEHVAGLYRSARTLEPELPEYEAFKAAGGYHYRDRKPFIAYQAQIEDFTHHPFATPSGKIEIFSKPLYDLGRHDVIPPIPGYVPCPEGPEDPLKAQYPLQLIGWHTKRRTHSIHDNNRWLESIEPQCLWMHPVDAEARGLAEGGLIEVFNTRGTIRFPVHITTRITPGVVAMAQGAWYTPESVAAGDTKDAVCIRGSINVLTSQRPTPLARGNPQHTNLVEVRTYSPSGKV
ncbi:MAG: molybdopterin-dependent oxidoreductase [Treponema sp.]|jgi:anaerobic dimethyl sulfoxide reductase subunit A|nr:molybdopterin-dependent oxidoreductase [Treponema sp.]